MSIHNIWRSLDDKLQAKFQGHYGEAAFREAVVITFMLTAHTILKERVPITYHKELDRAWYGSLAPGHPFHELRSDVQDKVADLAVSADNYFGGRLQDKFSWFDVQVPKLEAHVDQLVDRYFSPA